MQKAKYFILFFWFKFQIRITHKCQKFWFNYLRVIKSSLWIQDNVFCSMLDIYSFNKRQLSSSLRIKRPMTTYVIPFKLLDIYSIQPPLSSQPYANRFLHLSHKTAYYFTITSTRYTLRIGFPLIVSRKSFTVILCLHSQLDYDKSVAKIWRENFLHDT